MTLSVSPITWSVGTLIFSEKYLACSSHLDLKPATRIANLILIGLSKFKKVLVIFYQINYESSFLLLFFIEMCRTCILLGMCRNECSETRALGESENSIKWALRRESFLNQPQTFLQPVTFFAYCFATEFFVLRAKPPASLVGTL
jgi:hypothetical protein